MSAALATLKKNLELFALDAACRTNEQKELRKVRSLLYKSISMFPFPPPSLTS